MAETDDHRPPDSDERPPPDSVVDQLAELGVTHLDSCGRDMSDDQLQVLLDDLTTSGVLTREQRDELSLGPCPPPPQAPKRES